MVVAVLTHFSEWMSAIISTVCLQSLDRISHIILCIILIDIAQIACSAVVFVFMFCLCFWDDYGSRQSTASTEASFTAARCATQHVRSVL